MSCCTYMGIVREERRKCLKGVGTRGIIRLTEWRAEEILEEDFRR